MNSLTVLYDERCGFCRWARKWVEAQAKFLEVRFLDAGSTEARRRFPSLAQTGTPEDLVVVDDAGGVYRDGSAWVMVLYALEDYREWSLRLGSPALLPLARRAFRLLSTHRFEVSRWLHLDNDNPSLARGLAAEAEPACDLPASTGGTGNPSAEARLARLPRRELWTRSFG